MAPEDLNELKRKLRGEGFEIYRSQSGRVSLAERVRDNLILDSGISVSIQPAAPGYLVVIAVRAQASHFPGYPEDAVRVQAERLAEPFRARGYTETATSSQTMPDPSHPERVLDTVHEVALSREFPDWDSASAEIRAAFSVPRASSDD